MSDADANAPVAPDDNTGGGGAVDGGVDGDEGASEAGDEERLMVLDHSERQVWGSEKHAQSSSLVQ
jgi:hypothetical protein